MQSLDTNNALNDTETLVKEIIQTYVKNNNQGVSTENFIQNWKHWDKDKIIMRIRSFLVVEKTPKDF